MNYTLNQLIVFLKVSKTLSITKAAEELHLTQPAVSIQLKNFQDQFEIPLTELIGKKLYLTDFGIEIALMAEEIINKVDAINYKTLLYKGELSGRLKISVVSTGKYLIPYFLTKFLKQNPGVELELDVTNKQQVVDSLQHNRVDFGLVSILPDHLKLEKITLLPNKLYYVAGGGSRQTKLNSLRQHLQDVPFLIREEGSGTRQITEKIFNKYKVAPHRKMTLTSNEAVKQAVLAGLGSSIMPLIGLRDELEGNRVSILKFKGFPVETKWQLVWLKDKSHSPIANAYIKFLKSESEEIISKNFNWYLKY